MSKKQENQDSLNLSALDFGPAWARDKPQDNKNFTKSKPHSKGGDREVKSFKGKKREYPKRDQRDQRDGGNQRKRGFENKRPVPKERIPLPADIKASIMPKEEGVDNLVKQISATGRTYSVFELARLILKSRDRYVIAFQLDDTSTSKLYQSITDKATFLSEEECVSHFATSEKFSELYTSFEEEVEPPKGNFTSIACCGFTGEPIAPSNYHDFQNMLTERYNQEFSNMTLDQYKAKVKTEKDEEKVNAWLESMKKLTKYKLASDETTQFQNKTEALIHFKTTLLEEEYPCLKRAFVESDVSFKLISEPLSTGLLEVISEQNRYPGDLSSFLCRQLSGRKLAVYKWQNKLHAGPSRPHQLPEDSTIADRLQKMYSWVTENSGKHVDEMWKAVLSEDLPEEEKDLWFKDIKWMLSEGFLVLLEHGKIHLSSDSKKKKPNNQAKKQASPKSDAKSDVKADVKSDAESKPKASAKKEVSKESSKDTKPKAKSEKKPEESKDSSKSE